MDGVIRPQKIDGETLAIVKLVRLLNRDVQPLEPLDGIQSTIIYYLDRYAPLADVLDGLGLTISDHAIFIETSMLYAACIAQIERNRARLLEDELLSNYSNSTDTIKKLAITGNIPKYRDSYLPELSGLKEITIKLADGKTLDPGIGQITAAPTEQDIDQDMRP